MGIKADELLDLLRMIAPRELEEDWDNGGFQINIRNPEFSRIMVALEITNDVIKEAAEKKVDFIVTHHPLLMEKLDVIDADTLTGGYAIKLINLGITVYSAHTNFDAVFGGNNDYLADLLELQMVRRLKLKTPFGDNEMIGRMGSLRKPVTLKEMAEKVEKVLNLTEKPRVVGDLNAKISNVALSTGSGAESMDAAIQNHCDLFITGDVKYHQAQKAKEMGLNVIDAGHYGTEYIFIENFANILRKAVEGKAEIIESTSLVNPFDSVVY